MFDLLWNLYQHSQITELQERTGADRADAEIAGRQAAQKEVQRLEARLDRLVLVVHAMWTLLREQTNLTDADLTRRATELDAQDGTTDGRVSRPPAPCSKCGAMICRKFNRCLFCGEEYREGTLLDTV